MKFNTVILAAGMGKRLKTETCKVIVPLIGKPLIIHLLDNLQSVISTEDTYVVIGYQGEAVQKVVGAHYPDVKYAWQKEQLGTGHAVMQVKPVLQKLEQPTLILAGDVPLIDAQLISQFYEYHTTTKADISVLTANISDPYGYGRIVRDPQRNSILKIVEQKDATSLEKEITEINSGIYLVESKLLFDLLDKVTPNNKQNEYYLTDIIKIAGKRKLNIAPYLYNNPEQLRGVNSRKDMASIAKYIYSTTRNTHMNNGVTLLSPETTFIDPEVVMERDVIVEPFVHIKGKSHVKENTYISSFSYLQDYTSQKNEKIPAYFRSRENK